MQNDSSPFFSLVEATTWEYDNGLSNMEMRSVPVENE